MRPAADPETALTIRIGSLSTKPHKREGQLVEGDATRRLRSENRVQQVGSRRLADIDVYGDSDFASQLRIRSCPGRRWRWYDLWEWLTGTLLEGSCERAAEAFGVEFGQLTDQDEVDQILDPGAFPLVLPI